MKPVLITCGASKLKTGIPVQAWQLYTGNYFKTMLALAIRKSNRVFIVSAGYGVLSLNDLVLPYDRKMDNKRAKQFKSLFLFNEDYYSLLGGAYQNSVFGNPEYLTPVLKMGYKVQYMQQKIKELGEPLIDLQNLENGAVRNLII